MTIFVGLDWGGSSHAVCIVDAAGKILDRFAVAHDRDGLADLVARLRLYGPGLIGFLALAANLASVGFLMPYKDGDANVRSVWLCSRNDAIGNMVVMAAAFGVWGTSSAWPDLAVAALMAGIFLTSSVQILRQAWSEYREGAHDRTTVPAE